MHRIKHALGTLAVVLVLTGTGVAGVLPDLANWGGPSLLALLQDRVNGTVAAGQITGNPLTGLAFHDLKVTDPDGRLILAADRLEIRLSLWSLAAFRLDVGWLALTNPRLHLVREPSGAWNGSRMLKAPPEPKPPPGFLARLAAYFLREINLADLVMQGGELLITRGADTRRYADLDVRAGLVFQNLGQPQPVVKVKSARAGITAPQGRVEVETRLSFSAGVARIDSLQVQLAGRPLVALQGEVCRPLTDLSCTLTGNLSPLAGEKIREFWPRWPAPWDLTGAFSLSSTPAGGTLRLQGKIGQADYTIQGELNARRQPAGFHLELDLKDLSTDQLKDLKGQPLKGLSPVHARLRVEGKGLPWDPESMHGRLALQPFRYQNLKVDKVELDLTGNGRHQQLQMTAAGNFGAVELTAAGRLLPLGEPGQGPAGEIALKTSDFQPALAGMAQLPETSLTASFTGKFRLPADYSAAHAYLAGELQARGRVRQQPLQELTAGFVWEGKKLSIARADLRWAGLSASIKGACSEAGLDLTFTGTAADSRTLPLPPGPAFGALRAEGAVRGPWKAPQVNLTAQVQKFTFQGLALDSAHLTGALNGLPPQSGSLRVSGSGLRTPAGVLGRLNVTADGAGGHWQFHLTAASPPQSQVEVAGTAAVGGRPLVLSLTRFNWHSPALKISNQTPVQVRLFPGWEISPATLQVDGGLVTLAGQARESELSGRIEVKDLNAALLAPLGVAVSGKLNGRLTLAGNPRAPVLDGQLSLSGGHIKNMPVTALTTTLTYQAAQAQVSGYLELGPLHSRLVWKGTVPLRLSLLPWQAALANDGLDLRIHSEKLNLSLLTSLSRDVQTAEGPLDLAAEIRGNPRQPRVSGSMRWSAGVVQIHRAGTPYRLLPGEIRLQGDRIVIPGLVVQSDGTISLSGELLLAGTPQLQARGQADNFLLLNRGGNELWTNGYIDLKGPLSTLVATGRLIVPKAQFRPTFFRTGSDPDVILVPLKAKTEAGAEPPPAIYQQMAINVGIESPGNVWLNDPMGKMELAANLTANKEPGRKLALGGEIRSLRGTLEVQDRSFTVERAALILPGVVGKPLKVDLRAVHPMDDITLLVTVSGTVSNPQIRLESMPPLPPADVMSYLVFGAPAATLTREQYLALGAQTLGILGGITPKKIDEILGSTIPFLSGLKLRSGVVAGRPTIGVGKEIVQNVSVFVGRNFNEERGLYEQQMGIEYKINKNWSLESQIGPRNTGADVIFNYDF
jgi:hypothetical protein